MSPGQVRQTFTQTIRSCGSLTYRRPRVGTWLLRRSYVVGLERPLRVQKAVPCHSCMHHTPHGVYTSSRVNACKCRVCAHTPFTHTKRATRRHVRARVTYGRARRTCTRTSRSHTCAHAHTRRGITMPSCRCSYAPMPTAANAVATAYTHVSCASLHCIPSGPCGRLLPAFPLLRRRK